MWLMFINAKKNGREMEAEVNVTGSGFCFQCFRASIA